MRHRIKYLLLSLFAGVILLLAQAEGTGRADEAVPVIDGDTLVITGKLMQLAGIDAPELGQRCFNEKKAWRCGLEAALALRKLLAFGKLECKEKVSDAITPLAVYSVDGKDLATALLQQGYAIALPDADPTYQKAQSAAKEAKIGIWRGKFVVPAEWREGTRLPEETSGPDFCVIKGTINEQNQRVFYVPSDAAYESIVVDPARGERMFCSDDQAILRGWRPFPKNSSK